MSAGLPVVSGAEAVRALESVGYVVVRQRGDHVRLIDDTNPDHPPLTVPLHRELDRGLLRALIRDAGLTVDGFRRLLR